MRRIGPIVAVADIGYGFQDLMDMAKYYHKKYNIPSEYLHSFQPISISFVDSNDLRKSNCSNKRE